MPLVLRKDPSSLGTAYLGSYDHCLIIKLWRPHRETGFMLQRGTAGLLFALLFVGAVVLWRLDNGSNQDGYAGAALASAVTVASFLALLRGDATDRQSGIEAGGRV